MPSRTNLATGIPSSKVKYSRLSSTDDGYIDLQFKKSPPKIPYKAIALATVLFLIGAFLIIIGSLLLAGYISKGVYIYLKEHQRELLLALMNSSDGCSSWGWTRLKAGVRHSIWSSSCAAGSKHPGDHLLPC
ncbi:transmembrane protein 230 isoform X1 [Ochotona curzoniae]|uniref:transmembrane protein 230 isoform X1 n=1 Tax=Ochotona curzoniae TaxID=130825 RepID=UPI001B35309F|nr:transmembrane protein 230 isoform X1 [Ochotona curzoniae]XP_040836929.1 transmembrane protein 230 isoform X1 [Ochotona curzoniae]